MPYEIKRQGRWWVKVNKESGRVVSRHRTKRLAQASVRAYYANKAKADK
jgi:RNase P protein component